MCKGGSSGLPVLVQEIYVRIPSRKAALLPLVTLAVGLLVGPSARAGDDWRPVTPDELKMTSEPLAPGAPAIYLYRQVDRDDSGTATHEYNYVRIKVLTEEGRKYGNVEIPFVKGRTGVAGIAARTIHPDGSVVAFDGKVFENTIVKSKTLKFLAKTFTMPDVTVGSIIEYHYNYNFEDNYIFDSHWILSEELFTKQAQFTLKPYSEGSWVVQWTWPAGLPKGTQPPKEGARGVIGMTSDNIPAFQTEDYMPPENELKFRVDFIYHDSIPERDLDKFWAQFGKKQDDYAENFVNKRKAMEQAVAQIVAPGDAPELKLQKIYARVQQLRNLSYEAEMTEQQEKREKIKLPNSVEDVWKSGYGAGDQITWLFLALARAAGIEAHPCLVSSRAQYFFRKERMNSHELNTNVVLVKLNGKDLYFDPGAKFTPFGMLPWSETAVAGLRLDKNGGTWFQTPIEGSEASEVQRSADFKLSDDGSLEGKLKVTYTGLAALSRRVEERNEDDTARKKYLEDEVKEVVPVGIDVELTNTPAWNSSDDSLVAEFNLKVQGWLSSAGRRALLPAGFFVAPEKHMFEHANRVYPVYFSCPFRKIDDVTVQLPLAWQVTGIPKPFDDNAKAAEYSLKIEDDKGILHVHRELRSDLVMVPLDVYPVLRNFYQVVRTQDDQQLVLQPAKAAASN